MLYCTTCTKVDILQESWQLHGLVCWLKHVADNMEVMAEGCGLESATIQVHWFFSLIDLSHFAVKGLLRL